MTDPNFDLARLSLTPAPKPVPPACGTDGADGPPRPAAGELYLGGPIPLGWVSRAAALPGRALHVGLALWFDALVRRPKRATVQPRPVNLGRFGVGCRRSLYRALEALERAGLVRVERRPGRPFRVTLLPVAAPGRCAHACEPPSAG